MHSSTGARGAGARVDSVDHWAGRVRGLEAQIAAARARARASPPSPAFFAFIATQKAAAIAAQTNLHPEDGHSFHVVEAPGPEEARRPPSRPARGGKMRTSGGRALLQRPQRDGALLIARRMRNLARRAPGTAAPQAPPAPGSARARGARGPQVNWPTLWMPWTERDWREVLVLPLIIGIMLVPVGIFSGALPPRAPAQQMQPSRSGHRPHARGSTPAPLT